MDIPEHLWRHPTKAAIDSLALRLDLPNKPAMQDWEIEVADSKRILEFIATYEDKWLSDDERFTLMQTIIQSFEDSDLQLDTNTDWQHVLDLIEQNIELHTYTVWYWADSENKLENSWRSALSMRKLLERHKLLFEIK